MVVSYLLLTLFTHSLTDVAPGPFCFAALPHIEAAAPPVAQPAPAAGGPRKTVAPAAATNVQDNSAAEALYKVFNRDAKLVYICVT